MKEQTFHEKFSAIQQNLKAPKGQFNAFGKYKYRSCEDILEAVKPHLNGLILTLSDSIIDIGDRFYVEAVAAITDGEKKIEVQALAREEFSKKGMDGAQVTGSASSYARKYALNGLFCIDDNKDPDTRDNSEQKTQQPQQSTNKATPKQRQFIGDLLKQNNIALTSPQVQNLSNLDFNRASEVIESLSKKKVLPEWV